MIQKFFTSLSEQEKKILYVTVAFVTIALFDRVFFGPVFSKLKQLDDEIEQQENVVRRDLRFLSYQKRILDDNKKFQVYFEKSTQTEEEIIAAFLKKIEILATQAGVNLIKVSPSETKQKMGFVEYFAELECSGALDKTITFLHSIDASPDLMKTVKFTMSPQRASAGEVTATITVKKMIIDRAPIDEAIQRVVETEKDRKGKAGSSEKGRSPEADAREDVPTDETVSEPEKESKKETNQNLNVVMPLNSLSAENNRSGTEESSAWEKLMGKGN